MFMNVFFWVVVVLLILAIFFYARARLKRPEVPVPKVWDPSAGISWPRSDLDTETRPAPERRIHRRRMAEAATAGDHFDDELPMQTFSAITLAHAAAGSTSEAPNVSSEPCTDSGGYSGSDGDSCTSTASD